MNGTPESAGGPPGTGWARLRQLFDLEEYGAFQQLLEATIDGLEAPEGAAEANLQFLLHFAERACLDDRRIGALLDQLRPLCADLPELRRAWGAAALRRRVRHRLRAGIAEAFELVPLGLHCLPWTLGNRWGFRTRRQFATTLNPFCLAVHKPAAVIAALENDFAGYAEPSALRVTKSMRGHAIAMRADGTAVWNHSKGAAWLGEDFAPLLAGLARKAEAFRASAHGAGAVFLLANVAIHAPDEPIPFLPALQAALAKATGRGANRLILTAQPRQGEPADRWLDRDTVLLIRPYPARDYSWSDDATADSPAGLDFERGYAGSLLRCLLRWDLARRESAAA